MRENLVGLEPRSVMARHLHAMLGPDVMGESGYTEDECADLAEFLAELDLDGDDPEHATAVKLLLMQGLALAEADFGARILRRIDLQRLIIGRAQTSSLLQISATRTTGLVREGRLPIASYSKLGVRKAGIAFWLHRVLYALAFNRRAEVGGHTQAWPEVN